MSDNVPALAPATDDRWMAIVERVMASPTLPIDNLERILALRDREREMAALEDFNRSLAACQAEVKQIGRDKTNPAFRSRYSSLTAVDAEIRPIREKYGLGWMVSQSPAEGSGNLRYEGTISKGRIERKVYLEVDRSVLTGEGPRGGRIGATPIQLAGSVTSYMRRYLLMMAFDLVTADGDDDGEAARRPSWSPAPSRPEPRPDSYYDARTPQGPSRQEQVQAAQAIIDGGAAPKRNGWDSWLDKLQDACDKLVTPADWDELWSRETIKKAETELKGAHLDRFDAIRVEASRRVFPVPPAPAPAAA